MSVWSWAIPVITFAAGNASTFVQGAWTERRQATREKTARDAERHRVIVDRREAFELDHLVKTHAALSELARATGRAHHADSIAAAQGAPWGETPLPEDIDEQLLEATRKIRALKGLVLDDRLRALVDTAQRELNGLSGPRAATVGEREIEFVTAVMAMDEALNGLATRIREIYITAE